MKKKITILGSTGSIGKNMIEILKKDKKNIDIILLTANKNYNELIKQFQQILIIQKSFLKNLFLLTEKHIEVCTLYSL